MPDKFYGRKVKETKTFQVAGTFQSMYAAERWLKEQGYDTGSTCAPNFPTPVVKGNYGDYDLPQKWKNFTRKDELTVHGAITGNMREGPVTVYLFEELPKHKP